MPKREPLHIGLVSAFLSAALFPDCMACGCLFTVLVEVGFLYFLSQVQLLLGPGEISPSGEGGPSGSLVTGLAWFQALRVWCLDLAIFLQLHLYQKIGPVTHFAGSAFSDLRIWSF